MQVKLKVVMLTQNEDGTVTTKLKPELVGGPAGSFSSGDLFITVANYDVQPGALVYGAEITSDLLPFEVFTAPEEPTTVE